MRAALVGLLVVACQPVAAEVPTPTPMVVYVTPEPTPYTPTPTPFSYPTLDPRRVVVAMAATAGARERGDLVVRSLPTMWRQATLGRSEITMLSWTEFAPIYLVILDEQMSANQTVIRGHTQWLAGNRIKLINVYQTTDNPQLMRVVLHELGHALGCCAGPGNHWADCTTELMCHRPGESLIFSERELTQMGLGR